MSADVTGGVGVSLDDFGTGYSSLGLLKQPAVDELKIDRTFVGSAPEDTADAAIVQAVAGLAGSSACASSPRASRRARYGTSCAPWAATSRRAGTSAARSRARS